MENCRERCQTRKGVYETQRNLSYAKINCDSHPERPAGRAAATPAPKRHRAGPAHPLAPRSSRHSRSTMATWLWKNRSAVHLSFHKAMTKAHGIHTYTELRQQIHNDLRVQHPEWVQPNGESPICDSYESRLVELLADLEEIRARGRDAVPVHESK